MNTMKQHYKCIILILATNDTPHYQNCRKVWKQYININPDVKVFFAYGELSNKLEDQDSNDIIFDNVIENSTIQKTILGLKYISCNYIYDYLIRTNISTFWNLYNITELLDKCPKERCYAGGHDLHPFLIYGEAIINTPLYSGVCIMFTPDIIDKILNSITKINYKLPEDISIGLYMANINSNTYTITNKVYFEDYNITDEKIIIKKIEEGINNGAFYYRVKNMNNREHTDLIIYKHLLKHVYNIEFNLIGKYG